jgi:LysM repeat protein
MNKKLFAFCLFLCLLGLQGAFVSTPVSAAGYIVQPGDTLTHIARRFGTTVEAIVAVNEIANPDLILIGQVLDIPSTSAAALSARSIYTRQTLASGLNMGVDTSNGRFDWVTDMNGSLCMNYPSGQDWGAVFITVGEPTQPPRPSLDFSGYETLSLELRGGSGGETVSIGIKDNTDPDNGSETKLRVTNLTTEWQTFTFPLSSFSTADLSNLYVVTEFVFAAGTPAENVCFRNIQYLPDEASAALSAPIIEQLMIADFNSCSGTNNLGGQMGAAYQPPHNQLTEVYITGSDNSCVAKLEYQLKDWGAFWMKLPDVDLSTFQAQNGFLTFDIKANAPLPYGVQIEIKRLCVPNQGCEELSVYYITGITTEWQTRSIPMSGFGSTGWAPPLSTWNGIEELVFTFAYPSGGNNGTVYLDNIRFQR